MPYRAEISQNETCLIETTEWHYRTSEIFVTERRKQDATCVAADGVSAGSRVEPSWWLDWTTASRQSVSVVGAAPTLKLASADLYAHRENTPKTFEQIGIGQVCRAPIITHINRRLTINRYNCPLLRYFIPSGHME
ncbi:hypothetical protein FVE85_8053 [Porphyridium purpureum]|uniref:Uncharacterized protein n=1 Tax=Porphyridium purpureum TaxID=35688 RepID=A0A5J4YM87_PORPP|nr:hypothetical protein FVE85_8053 [Porphyridium purpureum]|eukprot:POR4052..scf295_9